MPIIYRTNPEKKIAYIKALGKVTVDQIMTEGARMFAEKEWQNGFDILCDYRGITEFSLSSNDVKNVVDQDKKNEPLFDNSKCAIVANRDLVFGFSRMWEILAEDTNLTKMVFRDIKDAMNWLGMDMNFLDSMQKRP